MCFGGDCVTESSGTQQKEGLKERGEEGTQERNIIAFPCVFYRNDELSPTLSCCRTHHAVGFVLEGGV